MLELKEDDLISTLYVERTIDFANARTFASTDAFDIPDMFATAIGDNELAVSKAACCDAVVSDITTDGINPLVKNNSKSIAL